MYILGTYVQPAGGLSAVVARVDTMVSAFIRNNNGRFPNSEDNLIHQGLLKKTESSQGYKYFMRPVTAQGKVIIDAGWMELPRFKLFQLKYGIEVNDIEQRNGKLYDKSTGSEFLLIEGSYKKTMKLLNSPYESTSIHWYKLMTSIVTSDANSPLNKL